MHNVEIQSWQRFKIFFIEPRSWLNINPLERKERTSVASPTGSASAVTLNLRLWEGEKSKFPDVRQQQGDWLKASKNTAKEPSKVLCDYDSKLVILFPND